MNKGQFKPKHGMRTHYLYPTWNNIMQRCYNPQRPGYVNYGGRGITVCPAWLDCATFITDVEKALGPRPIGYSFDRIDNNGNYVPGNVRWATRSQQNINRRSFEPAANRKRKGG